MQTGHIQVSIRAIVKPIATALGQADSPAERRLHGVAGRTAEGLWKVADGISVVARGVDGVGWAVNALGHKAIDAAGWLSDQRDRYLYGIEGVDLDDSDLDPRATATINVDVNAAVNLDFREADISIKEAHEAVQHVRDRGFAIAAVYLRRDQEEQFNRECDTPLEDQWPTFCGAPVIHAADLGFEALVDAALALGFAPDQVHAGCDEDAGWYALLVTHPHHERWCHVPVSMDLLRLPEHRAEAATNAATLAGIGLDGMACAN